MREMGLGRAGTDLAAVPLAEARQRAAILLRTVRAGIDPLAKRDTDAQVAKVAALDAAARAVSFRSTAEAYVTAHQAGWTNSKHLYQWQQTLRAYIYPVIGDLRVADVGTEHVLAILEPIWRSKSETATRVRGRIEAVLDYAKVRQWRTGENPARWRGHLDHLLPARSKVAKVEHHAALPWREIGAFMAALRSREGIAVRALEFAILTAARTGEALGAKWGEVDLYAAVWTVPAARMKARQEHRVPLSPSALALLDDMGKARTTYDPAAPIFPGHEPGRQLSNMALLMTLRRMGRDDLTAHGCQIASNRDPHFALNNDPLTV